MPEDAEDALLLDRELPLDREDREARLEVGAREAVIASACMFIPLFIR